MNDESNNIPISEGEIEYLARKAAARKAFDNAKVQIGAESYLYIWVTANDVGMADPKKTLPFVVSLTDADIEEQRQLEMNGLLSLDLNSMMERIHSLTQHVDVNLDEFLDPDNE